MTGRQTAMAAIIAAGVLATGAAPAAAGSIALLRDGDVYLAADDAAGAVRQVTSGGGYGSVTQADNGRLFASKGTFSAKLVELTRGGDVVKEIPVPGPVLGLSASPDGRTVAVGKSFSPGSGCPFGCSSGPTTGTLFARTDGSADPESIAFKNVSWLTNDRVVGTSGDVWTIDVPSGEASQWFRGTYPNGSDLADDDEAEINADGTAMVVLRDSAEGGNRLLGFYLLNGPPPAAPTFVTCELPAGGTYASPSWSPTSPNSLVVEVAGQGLLRVDLAGLRPGAPCDASFGSTRALGEGASPDWGPAAVGAATPGGGTTAPGVPRITAAKITGKLLSVTLSAAGAITVDVTRGPRKLGQIARFGIRGTTRISLAKVKSRPLKAGRYKAKVTAVTAAGRSASRTLTFTIRR